MPVLPLDPATAPSLLGGKGSSLVWLMRNEARVPPGWVVPPGPFEAPGPPISDDARYAIRSSANVEDGDTASFAGQFLTMLDVTGTSEIGEAIKAVRASAATAGVKAYADHSSVTAPIEMSVIVQQMIPPAVSGVVFTRNPITGLNEVVLESVEGRGDQLVSEGVTPQRWIHRWGEWTAAPAEPHLPEAVATAIVAEAKRLAERYEAPADLEWVWDGAKVWWLQIRPITGIDDVGVYSNRISKEVMPGLIKPLVWSVNVPVVNRAWIDLFTQAIGPNDLTPGQLAKPFAYRSYFNMGTIGSIFELMGMPRDSLESLIGLPEGPEKPRFKPSRRTILKTPKLMAFAWAQNRYGKKADAEVSVLADLYKTYDRDLSDLSDRQLFDAVEELTTLGTRAAYANIVVPLLANLYSALLRRSLDKRGLDLAAIDLGGAGDGLDPNPQLDRLAGLIQSHGADAPIVREALDDFLARFGHFSDSGNDFSVPPWREQPDLVLAMAEHRTPERTGGSLIPWADTRSSLGARRLVLERLRKRTIAYLGRRDAVSSMYTYGYGLFRRYFLELGRRLVERGAISSPDDVMYLTIAELREVFDGTTDAERARSIVEYHKAELARVADVVMPEVIYGDDFIAAPAVSADGVLKGIGTARGHHRGPVRVVKGLADFHKVEPGDVLAIPFSDVGWTPLFAMAGAVIAESGGMLSHSSIVAREYGIPCVVSVPGVTRLTDGVVATVDGYRGEVMTEARS